MSVMQAEQVMYNVIGSNLFRICTWTGILFWTIVVVCGLWVVGAWIFSKVKN